MLGLCKDWCKHEARGNGVFVCWKCGHVIRFTNLDAQFEQWIKTK